MKKKLTFFLYFFLSLASLLSLFFIFHSKIAFAVAPRVADEILVKFKNIKNIAVVKISQIDSFAEILDYYQNQQEVEYAEPNFLYHASIIPSDTYFTNQWHLQKIKAVEAWNQIRESPDVTIAIIDSGVQISHPDLASNIWVNSKEIAGDNIDNDKNGYVDDIYGWDFVNNVADPSPKFIHGFTEAGILHGTVVAGIAAASGNNATGIAGVTWRAKIMALKVLDDKGEGSTDKVVKAIDYAVVNGADIINLSFVGAEYSNSLNEAIKRAYSAGVIIVAAAGNEENQNHGRSLDVSPMYPVCNDGVNGENMVVGVAGLDAIDQKTSFSSYGFKCVDIAAPGVNIYSTLVYSPANYFNNQSFNNYYGGYWSGTSVAVPMVSGALALISAANPSLSRERILEILYSSSDNLNRLNPNYLNQLGKGRLNVAEAVRRAEVVLKSNFAKIVIAPFSNFSSVIKITDQNGREEKEFFAYGDKFNGGINLAAGDVNGDGADEIITGAGQGGGPHVRIFNNQGELIGQFFAYPDNWRGGVNVAVGDIDSDNIADIITVPGRGYNSEIKIFDFKGKLKKSFLAYDKQFKGGVSIAIGDVNGDNKNEIITGAGQGGGPHVRVFNINGQAISQFFAFDKNFRGGVKVAVGNIITGARSKNLEIIVAPGKGGGPQIRVLDSRGNLLKQFFAFKNNFRGGINVSAGDLNNDGIDEIVVGAGPGGAPHMRVFDINYKIISSFYAFEESFNGGINVAVIKKF